MQFGLAKGPENVSSGRKCRLVPVSRFYSLLTLCQSRILGAIDSSAPLTTPIRCLSCSFTFFSPTYRIFLLLYPTLTQSTRKRHLHLQPIKAELSWANVLWCISWQNSTLYTSLTITIQLTVGLRQNYMMNNNGKQRMFYSTSAYYSVLLCFVKRTNYKHSVRTHQGRDGIRTEPEPNEPN